MGDVVDMKVSDDNSVNFDSKESRVVSDILQLKLKELALKKKRRVLLEEIYRQYLEGETEPKRRRKNPKKCTDEKIIVKVEEIKVKDVNAEVTPLSEIKIEDVSVEGASPTVVAEAELP